MGFGIFKTILFSLFSSKNMFLMFQFQLFSHMSPWQHQRRIKKLTIKQDIPPIPQNPGNKIVVP
jgi:hypothetical protein